MFNMLIKSKKNRTYFFNEGFFFNLFAYYTRVIQ